MPRPHLLHMEKFSGCASGGGSFGLQTKGFLLSLLAVVSSTSLSAVSGGSKYELWLYTVGYLKSEGGGRSGVLSKI